MTDIARLEGRLKRRNVGNSYFRKKSNRNALTVVENNQAKEMPELVEYRNFVSSSTYEHGDYDCYDDVGDQNQDPHYNMFLNNVKKDGQSYALVVSQKNDVPDLLKYEIVDLVGGDECGAEAPEAIEAPPEAIESYPVNRKIKAIKILRRLSRGENAEIPDSSTSFSSIRVAWSPRTLRYLARNSIKGEISGTSDGGVSKRRKVCSAGRKVGRETSVRSGVEGNCLIEYEFDREGDADDDVLSERRKRRLPRRRADKEHRDPKSSGTSLRSGSESTQLVENEFDHDNDEDDDDVAEEYIKCPSSGYGGIGSKGNCSGQHLSDHEGDDECGAEAPEAIEAPPEAIESYPVNRKIKGIKILRRLSRGESAEIPDSSTSFPSIRDAWSPRTLRYHARNSRKGEISGTSDGGVSTRRKVCSAGRNAGRETSVRSGLEGNCLIEYEFDREGDADDDVLSERRKSRLPRRRAGKERRDPKSSGTSLRSGSESTQLVENGFDHDNDEDDDDVAEEYIRCPSSGYGGIGSEGNCSGQHLSDHEGDDECGAEAPEAIEAPPEAIESYPVNRKIKGIKILRRLSRGENAEIPDSSTSFSSIRDAWSPRTLRYHARNSRKGEISGTSDGGVSKRRKVCSAGRNVGRETSVRSGLEGNCLIEYEFDREGDADDDVLSERRKSRLPRRRAGKEHRDPKSSGTSLRSGSESTQLVENGFDHDNDEDDDDVAEEYIRCPSSGYGGIGSEGNCSEQHLSDHEGEFEDDYIKCPSSGYRGIGSKGNFSEQHLSDHEGEFDEEYIKILNSGYLRTCSEGNFSAQRQNDDVLEDFSTYLDSVECRYDHEDEIDDDDGYHRLVDPARGGTNRQSNRRPRLKVSHSVERECDREDSFDDADQEYLRFLHQLDKDGDASTYKIHDSPERSNKVEECESDVEIIEMDKDPYRGGTTPFVSSKQHEQIDVDGYSLAEDPSMGCSQFKKGLMEDLKRPYDSRELATLKENVSRRKPVLRDRVMRKSTKSYPVEHKRGKSYLDLYSDFAKELDQVKNDNLKSLNLLRGFFYWLKHLTQDKGFMPWRDPSCLEVLPKITGRTQRVSRSKCKTDL